MTIYNGDKYMGLSEYMLYGGIPLVVLREGANDKAVALQNLFNEIYLRDITKRNRVKNMGELEDLLNILSSAIFFFLSTYPNKNLFESPSPNLLAKDFCNLLRFSILLYPDRLQKSIYHPLFRIDFCDLLHFSILQSYYML